MQLRENQFERAAELFFEAAAVPEHWPRALQAVADACGAAGAVLLPVHPGTPVVLPSPGVEDYVADLVADGWSMSNSRMERGLKLTRQGMRGLISDSDMFTPDELRADAFFNEFVRPHRMGATAGMVLASYERELILPLSMERRAATGPFLPAEVNRMNRLMATVKPAAELALRVGFAASRLMADGLNSAGKDIALVGPSGRVIHSSPGFERHLGSGLTLRAGHLRSVDAPTDRLIADAVRRAVHRAWVGERLANPIPLPRGSRRPLIAQVVPIAGAGQESFMLARAMIILTDPEVGNPIDDASLALAAMGLTPAEVRLARRMGAGEDLRMIAEAERISLETARARLKSVFGKTGTHRQAELAVFVARLRP